MNNFLKFIFVCFVFSFGYGISKFIGVNDNAEREEVETFVKDTKGEEELRLLILNKYYKESEPAKKLVASDEIMEKIMLLFMANLGFKLSEQERELVESPKSYDQYLKEVLTMCPSLPKKTGPEVFLNDGSDEMRVKLLAELKTCKKTYGGLIKKAKLKNETDIENFVSFKNSIFKNSVRGPEAFFAFDIYSDLWGPKPFSEKLEGLPQKFVKDYLGRSDGIYRTRSGEQGPITLRLTETSKSKDGSVLLKLSLSTKLGLYLDEVYSAEHPRSHSSSGSGPCRGMVLSKGSARIIHLIKVPSKDGYFGRIYSGDEVVSSFFVSKDFSKKGSNPSRWGKSRGFK